MYRPYLTPLSRSPPWRDTWPRLLTPLTLWICVAVTVRYGYFGDCRMVLGPSSSRLVKANSLFIEEIEARDDDKKGVSLHSFSEKPELSFETNWTVSDYLIVGSYSRKGFSLWLNRGSKIYLRLDAHSSILDHLEAVMLKGERNFETLVPKLKNSFNATLLNETISGKEAKYAIEEDDRYYLDIINTNSRSIITTLNVSVSSKMYNLTKAQNECSTTNGSCRVKLLFADTKYVVLTTPNTGKLDGWYIEISFMARVVTYIALLGFIVIVIFLIFKYLGGCDGENSVEYRSTPVQIQEEITETHPILPEKPIRHTYGTGEEDEEDEASSTSSEDLYDAKLCVICYDDQRNCFFVPCGHCATCYDCAQRIMAEESKVCPICRRLVHKVRRLFNP
ncbi:hypothetical protein UlMin_035347 [Ulmus minor]